MEKTVSRRKKNSHPRLPTDLLWYLLNRISFAKIRSPLSLYPSIFAISHLIVVPIAVAVMRAYLYFLLLLEACKKWSRNMLMTTNGLLAASNSHETEHHCNEAFLQRFISGSLNV